MPVSGTYANVDGADNVADAIAWQDRVDAWPQVAAYKRRSYELLPATGRLLDVGSGTAHDLLAIGRAAIGIDASMAMCRTARARDAVVARAEADALPFPDESFAGVRADRVLAHVSDPDAAIAEMVRVTRRGGRLVIADPDQGSLVIHVPGARPDLVATVRRLRRDVGYRNGTLARDLPRRLAAVGLQGLAIEAFPLLLTDPDDAFGITTWVDSWRQHFTASDVEEWDAAMQRGREAGGFVYALLYFVVSGTRP
jgi:SAM-dependent methyltransferase